MGGKDATEQRPAHLKMAPLDRMCVFKVKYEQLLITAIHGLMAFYKPQHLWQHVFHFITDLCFGVLKGVYEPAVSLACTAAAGSSCCLLLAEWCDVTILPLPPYSFTRWLAHKIPNFKLSIVGPWSSHQKVVKRHTVRVGMVPISSSEKWLQNSAMKRITLKVKPLCVLVWDGQCGLNLSISKKNIKFYFDKTVNITFVINFLNRRTEGQNVT